MSAPGWMVAEVAEGLQRLIVLRLEGAPPVDAIDGVVMAWVDALLVRNVHWDEALDAKRLREAFRRLAAHAERWPAPVRLFEFLPAREQRRSLPRPDVSEDQRSRVQAMLSDVLKKLRRVP